MFGKNKDVVHTVINPFTEIDDFVVLTNSLRNNMKGFIVDINKIKTSEMDPNVLHTVLPKKSNLYQIEEYIEKKRKEMKHSDCFKNMDDESVTKVCVDTFNRIFYEQVEKVDDISYKIRGDIINDIILKGKIPIQCIGDSCYGTFPNKLNVDYTDFVITEVNI